MLVISEGCISSALANCKIMFTTAALSKANQAFIKSTLFIIGTVLLIFSLIDFLSRERLHQQSPITGQIVPMIILVFFTLLTLICIYTNLAQLIEMKANKTKPPDSSLKRT